MIATRNTPSVNLHPQRRIVFAQAGVTQLAREPLACLVAVVAGCDLLQGLVHPMSTDLPRVRWRRGTMAVLARLRRRRRSELLQQPRRQISE